MTSMDGSAQTDEARWDRWAASLGGYASPRFDALYREAIEFAGVDGCVGYLEMAMEQDEAREAHKRDRGARVRAEVARRATERAAAAALQRATEIKLAVDDLAEHLHLADPDFSSRPPMGRAEVDVELRAALGLAVRAPTAFQAMLPPVGDLARVIGLRS
jgi:hypothetical protein